MSEALKTKLSVLQKVAWLTPAGEEVLHALAQDAHFETFPDGQLVGLQGQDVNYLYVVAQGHLESSASNAAGKRHILGQVNVGETAGLIPLMDEQGEINDLTARNALRLLLIPGLSFKSAMLKFPLLAQLVIRMLSQRSRRLYRAAAERVLFRLDVRLARQLLELSRLRASTSILVSQDEMAEMLGVTRQSVNAEIKSMERSGWIQVHRGGLRLLNEKQLQLKANSE